MSARALSQLARLAVRCGWPYAEAVQIAADMADLGLSFRAGRRQLRRMEGLA